MSHQPSTFQNPHPAVDGGGDASAPSDTPGVPEDSGPPMPPNAQNGIGVEQNENGFRFVLKIKVKFVQYLSDR